MIKPELMAPAGYWPQLKAAIEAGADAVYFGLTHFSARAKVGFALAELPAIMTMLHERGVRGYLTFNALVFDHEIAAAVKILSQIARAGVDAVILQDVGLARLANRIAPDLPLHASTQMTVTNADGIRFIQSLGIRRVILSRELSLDDIAVIRREIPDFELEIFVHGALCISYSGQCFASAARGGRSANRGQCAQACRWPYELIVDGQRKSLGDARYLLSPGDLIAIAHLPRIMALGINALKIEGRYKDEQYVALTTRLYRRAIDEAWQKRPSSVTPAEVNQLAQVYSRGLGDYYLIGTDHQTVVRGRTPRHRGLLMGHVEHIQADSVTIRLANNVAVTPIKPGDGLVFDAADWRSPQEKEEGGRVYEVIDKGHGRVELKFGNNVIDFSRIRPGDWVWRTQDPDLDKLSRPITTAESPVHRQPVLVQVTAKTGAPLKIHWQLLNQPQISTTIISEKPLEIARNQGTTVDYLREQLGRLGNTPYILSVLETEISATPFIPGSLLNNLRRQAVHDLQAQQRKPIVYRINDAGKLLSEMLTRPARSTGTVIPQIHLLVRTSEQLRAAQGIGPDSITLDFPNWTGIPPAIAQLQDTRICVRVASPRILKPADAHLIDRLIRFDCPLLVRSTGLLAALSNKTSRPLFGDFSLNTANALTANVYREWPVQRITPNNDLNAHQIEGLTDAVDPDFLEVVAYQHLPLFHTEHCIFCRFLSTGTRPKNCGRPCEKHSIMLGEPGDRRHPVLADAGCRNTVFSAEAQTAENYLASWQTQGIRHYRLEFVDESAFQVEAITLAFRRYWVGKIDASELGRVWRKNAPQGITPGTLRVPDGYRELPVLL